MEWQADVGGHLLQRRVADRGSDPVEVLLVIDDLLENAAYGLLREVAARDQMRRVADCRHRLVLARIATGRNLDPPIAGIELLHLREQRVVDREQLDVAGEASP